MAGELGEGAVLCVSDVHELYSSGWLRGRGSRICSMQCVESLLDLVITYETQMQLR